MRTFIIILFGIYLFIDICKGQITPPKEPEFKSFSPVDINRHQPTAKQSQHTQSTYQYIPQGATAEDIIRQQNQQAKALMKAPSVRGIKFFCIM